MKNLGKASWSPPRWMYRDRRPPNNDAYFENMTRVIFLAGLKWKMIDEKWPNFKKAFKNFSIDEVAKFNENDVKRLMNDASIVRNRAKIIATINNAKKFQASRKEHESFRSYLDQLNKSEDYALAINELSKKFNRLGPSSARLFLYSVGEKVRPPED